MSHQVALLQMELLCDQMELVQMELLFDQVASLRVELLSRQELYEVVFDHVLVVYVG